MAAAELYAEASRVATSVPERDHLTRQAARVRHCCVRESGQLGLVIGWRARRRMLADGPRQDLTLR